MVAPSFQNFEKLSEPYLVSGKMYIRVKNPKTGTERQVRWYDDKEYKKAFKPKDETNNELGWTPNLKVALGFEKGNITIFKFPIDEEDEWFKASAARYCVHWGWYFPSTAVLPSDLPEGLEPISLSWEQVSKDGTSLLPKGELRAFIDKLLYGESISKHQGSIGERLERTLTVIKIVPIENYFGLSNFYLFTDADENEYCWTTAAKQLKLGSTYEVRGSIKDLSRYKGKEQTILTRCKILDKLN